MSPEIEDLIRRLEALTSVYDVDLQAEAMRALGYEVAQKANGWRMVGDEGRWQSVPDILRSVDAALGLARRRGLVMRWMERDAGDAGVYSAGLGYVENPHAGRVGRGIHRELSVAITVAMIREASR